MKKEELGLPWHYDDVWMIIRDDLYVPNVEEKETFILKAVNNHHALVEALEGVTELWCDLVNSGDAGNWNPETDEPIIASRKVLEKVK